jgi:HTH-type transcriptional regulator/antitoxin HigA
MERINMGITAQQVNNHTAHIPADSLDLQKEFFELRPIHNKTDYHKAFSVAEEISSLSNLTCGQKDYLEVLTRIIADYEEKHFEMSKHNPRQILRFLVEENQMNGSDLGRILGNRTLGPALLRGRRSLSKSNIKKLADYFSVSPALFLE